MKKRLKLTNSLGESIQIYTTEDKELVILELDENRSMQFNSLEISEFIEELQYYSDSLTPFKKK